MIPRRIANATHRLGAPQNWDADRGGNCTSLMCRVVQDKEGGAPVYESAWEPTPAELAMLNKGGSLILRIVGMQPPVALYAEPIVEEVA